MQYSPLWIALGIASGMSACGISATPVGNDRTLGADAGVPDAPSEDASETVDTGSLPDGNAADPVNADASEATDAAPASDAGIGPDASASDASAPVDATGTGCTAARALAAGVLYTHHTPADTGVPSTACRPSDAPQIFYSITIPSGQRATVTVTPRGPRAWRTVVRALNDCGATSCLSDGESLSPGEPVAVVVDNPGREALHKIITVSGISRAGGGAFDIAAHLSDAPVEDAGSPSPTDGSVSCRVPVARTLSLPTDEASGTLADGDSRAQGTCATDASSVEHLYALHVTERTGVTVETPLRGTAAWISIRRQCDDATSELVCDDGGDNDGDTYGYWPRIRRVLQPGDYYVSVAGPPGRPYRLQVSTFVPPASSQCTTATELSPDVSIQDDSARGGDPATACHPSPRPQHFYAVTVPPGQRAIVRGYHSNYDTQLALRAYAECAAAMCLGAATSGGTLSHGMPSRLTAIALDNPGATPRRMIVGLSSIGRSEAEFGARAEFVPMPSATASNARCEGAIVLSPGTPLAAQNTAHTAAMASCDNEHFQGQVLYYRVTVPAGATLVARAAASSLGSITPYIRVMDACGASRCLAGRGGVGDVTTVRLANTATVARDWVLAVGDTFPSAGGSFDLQVGLEP